VVCCGNGEARRKNKGKKVGKGEYEVWKGRKRRRKEIMKRGMECTSLLGFDAVRWASSTNILNSCIAVATRRVVLRLLVPEENALRSCKSPAH